MDDQIVRHLSPGYSVEWGGIECVCGGESVTLTLSIVSIFLEAFSKIDMVEWGMALHEVLGLPQSTSL